MQALLNATLLEYLKENLVLVIVLAVIAAAIVGLLIALIVTLVKRKRNAGSGQEPEPEKEPEPEQEPEPEKEPEPEQEPVKEPVEEKKQVKKEPVKKAAEVKVSAINGKWVIENVSGKFWLSLVAPNGQVMLESPSSYASLQGAKSGIKTYQYNIAAGRHEVTELKNGDSQVQIMNGNGRLLATSSTYSSKAQAESALSSIKRWAPTTAIEVMDNNKE